jgi:hypothetical protein
VTDLGNEKDENQKKTAGELDDESLFDRLFPDELRNWLRGLLGDDDEDDDGEEQRSD